LSGSLASRFVAGNGEIDKATAALTDYVNELSL
jgi:hypothetical protein